MAIENLEKKLNGEIPLTREDLDELVKSWGWEGVGPKECYDLSKLDVSQITDMIELFRGSHFDGDISSWDVSNIADMSFMFDGAEAFLDKYNNG